MHSCAIELPICEQIDLQFVELSHGAPCLLRRPDIGDYLSELTEQRQFTSLAPSLAATAISRALVPDAPEPPREITFCQGFSPEFFKDIQ